MPIKTRLKPTTFVLATMLVHALLRPNFVSAEIIKVYTGPLPPYSFTKDFKQTGLITEVVYAIKDRTKDQIKILARPWSRALKETEAEESLIYPFARTDYRESKFLWLGPIVSDHHIRGKKD